jgi:hypothetical protein
VQYPTQPKKSNSSERSLFVLEIIQDSDVLLSEQEQDPIWHQTSDKKRKEKGKKKQFSGTRNRTRGYCVRDSNVNHYTIPEFGGLFVEQNLMISIYHSLFLSLVMPPNL